MHKSRLSKTSQWVRDTDNVKKDAIRNEFLKHQQQKLEWAKEQVQDSVYVENDLISPANEESQLGKVLNTLDFENKLKRLIPNLYFETNKHNDKMKALYILKNNTKEYLGAYHAGFMPEHSIVKVKEEMVWDPEQTNKPLNRADLPKWNYTNGGRAIEFESAERPGWRKRKIPAGELKRGWRTILIKLVLKGLISPEKVEINFGEPSSYWGKRAWGYYSGKQKGYTMPF